MSTAAGRAADRWGMSFAPLSALEECAREHFAQQICDVFEVPRHLFGPLPFQTTEGHSAMSTTLTPSVPPSTEPEVTTELATALAVIACGAREGKTRACDRHTKQAATLVRIAATGALDALSAAICGSDRLGACASCTDKAEQIISAYQEGTR
ncbi:hypothetical protein LUR56_39925 [Streptomyces sp. MT29]|nr:hypothetical protein [Streptomyces sp. MT29]